MGGVVLYAVREFIRKNGKNPYRDWLSKLDMTTKARIQARIFRFETGNLGDYKSVGDGVYEARLDFGPGYRIYFGLHQNRVILLLVGGDKSTQSRDIAKAHDYWEEFLGG